MRVPIPSSSLSLRRSITKLLPEGLAASLEEMPSPLSSFHTSDGIGAGSGELIERFPLLICPVIALLLTAVRALLDDRRGRREMIPGTFLSPLLSSFLKFYSDFGTLGVDLTTSRMEYLPQCLSLSSLPSIMCLLADFRMDGMRGERGDMRGERDDLFQSSNRHTDSKPESNQYNSYRICCSLFTQLIARFFVVETVNAKGERGERSTEEFVAGQVIYVP